MGGGIPKKLKVATLFSGVGTPEYALKKLGVNHKTIFACEIDKFARMTYLANHSEVENFYEDVSKLDVSKFKWGIDLLVGGSPCQSFSLAGKRGGFEDTRGTLFFDYARIVKECKPKVFVYENVKGLRGHDKGKTFTVVKNTFRDFGYDIKFQVMDTKSFGVPQSRERVYIIGTLGENTFEFPEPIPLTNSIRDFLEDEVDQKYLLRYKQVKARKESSYNVRRNSIINIDNKSIGTLCARDYKEPKGISICKCDSNRRRVKYPPTIRATDIDCTHDISNYIFRKLTPREYFNLQGFGDDFILPKSVSDSQKYKQAGNGMSVNVLEAIFKELIKKGIFNRDVKKHYLKSKLRLISKKAKKEGLF